MSWENAIRRTLKLEPERATADVGDKHSLANLVGRVLLHLSLADVAVQAQQNRDGHELSMLPFAFFCIQNLSTPDMSAQDKFRYYISQIDKEVGSVPRCLTP